MLDKQIILDFFGGTHGHFLEYIINVYIFNAVKSNNLFDQTGGAHNKSKEYINSRQVVAQHYTENQIFPVFPFDKVIRIDFDTAEERIIYLINVLHRAGGIPKHKKELEIKNLKNLTQAEMRQDYYSKFQFVELGHPIPNNWYFDDKKILTVKMSDLYDYVKICMLMQNIAIFTNMSFKPDNSFFKLWKQFIDQNQGINTWNTCKNIFYHISSGKDLPIDIDIEHQAVLNYMITNCYNVYEGEIFTDDIYPANTNDIWKIIEKQIDNYDIKFPD